ncbi:hypothetical protein BU14_0516s0003 [Porphyra umbilicalis]|uniref:Ribosomal RNA methyltransferase FtsJ domain-containing protein n=1 Tax=Porphyra umbilicalis TaxID=2786 RepID=A0A1X6NST0_PORUM|nr:hypothetical protein BU14_0516s0003 [Porphyra umbilicalis]|eukprot:OSX71648.1 hypothetical protein BU14_0516s0003 [Porphyra umbilicalis]
MPPRSKAKRDIFYRQAKSDGYRARSAYKLLQLDEAYGLLGPAVTRVVDLCAAPGSWSQIAPIGGVTLLRGDITTPACLAAIRAALGSGGGGSVGGDSGGGGSVGGDGGDGGDRDGGTAAPDGDAAATADLVVSDGAPDVTGVHPADAYVQSALVLSALNVATAVLAPGGAFVAKVFAVGGAMEALTAQLGAFFDAVGVAKPRSSRATSAEAFVVGRGYRPPGGWVRRPLAATPGGGEGGGGVPSPVNAVVDPFVGWGDLDGGWGGEGGGGGGGGGGLCAG